MHAQRYEGYRTYGRIIGGLGLAAALALGARSAPAAAEEMTLGYVDLAKVFDEYQRTKESEQLLEQQGKQKQTDLETKVNELKKLRQSLELLSDQAKDGKAREIEEKSDEFQRLKTRTERELVRGRNQVARDILGEIEQAVTDYAKTNGLSLVLDRRSVLYGQPSYDMTEAVLRFLNERYVASKGAKR